MASHSIKNLDVRSLVTHMKDDYTTNSHYLSQTLLLGKVGRMYSLNLGVNGLTCRCILYFCTYLVRANQNAVCLGVEVDAGDGVGSGQERPAGYGLDAAQIAHVPHLYDLTSQNGIIPGWQTDRPTDRQTDRQKLDWFREIYSEAGTWGWNSHI